MRKFGRDLGDSCTYFRREGQKCKRRKTGGSSEIQWTFLVAQMVKNLLVMQEIKVQSLGWEDPLEEGLATHINILAWRILMGRGAWQATIPGITKSWTRLSD